MLLPIARKNSVVTPFLLGDHHVLKTAVLSPQNYDREMVKCLYKHTQIIEDGQEIKVKYEDLISQMSNIDKVCLLWACYKSTYENLGIREVACEKCKEKAKYKITLDELIQPDSLTVWDESLPPFYEYVYPITISYDEYEFVFEASIPTIQKYNLILGMISIEKIKNNLESGSVLSGSEELAILIKRIVIKKSGAEITKSDNTQEILTVLDCAIPTSVAEDFQEQYKKAFDKYSPKFYTHLSCNACKHSTKYTVDIETEFFRRILSGKGTVGEEL